MDSIIPGSAIMGCCGVVVPIGLQKENSRGSCMVVAHLMRFSQQSLLHSHSTSPSPRIAPPLSLPSPPTRFAVLRFKYLFFSDGTKLSEVYIITHLSHTHIVNMLNQVKKRPEKITVNGIKFPDIHNPHEERESSKEKDLTDPPLLKKGNMKPINHNNSNKDFHNQNRLVELIEKTQGEFVVICRQMVALQERQENFNAFLTEQMQKSSQVRSQPISSSLAAPPSSPEEVEFRDRYFFIDTPTTRKSPDWIRQLKRWISKLFTRTFSVAFHHFSRNEMTFEQTKIFCSMNILYNLVKLNKSHEITSEVIEELDRHLKEEVLVHLQKKYPLTEEQAVNKSLESIVQETDNLSGLSNNYFAWSDVLFEYRQSGNYNDLIMRMLNDIISKLDEKAPFQTHKKHTNFTEFKRYMTEIFEIVEEEDDVESVLEVQEELIPNVYEYITDKLGRNAKSALRDNAAGVMKDSSKIRQIEREKYRNKVREFTHYKIGRKIPETVPLYAEKEIESQNLSIKHPTIFRMLTKWCEELRRKFTASGYFASYSDNIKVQRGNIVNSLLFPMRTVLDEELRKEEGEIALFMKSLSHSNYQMQRELLQKEANKYEWYELEDLELEKICGRYSIEMLNSLHSYLIAYLNRLIHGLMNVAKRFYDRCELAGNSNWPSPPNLLTFTLGDLMRCKISSKEREILRIYQHIRQLSLRYPQKLKIVRIKNRLNQSTNDILLNIRFNGLILCEVQLAVKTEASEFIKCSNIFCHYLYELERSPFGSIAELCNIWAYLDRRAESYKEAMEVEAQKQYLKRLHNCDPSSKKQPYDKPFICHCCDLAYYHNNYLRTHLHCLGCNHTICAKCQLKEERQGEIVENLIFNKKLRKNIEYMINRVEISSQILENELPEFGVCIYIEAKCPKIEVFRLIVYKNRKYILGRNSSGQIYEIDKIEKEKDLTAFMRKYVIFKLNNLNNEHLQLSVEEAIESYILPNIIRQFYRQEKESIVLGDRLTNGIIQSVLKVGSAESKEKITKLFLDHNQITDISYIAKDFANLQILELSYNKIKNLDEISALAKLKSLSLVASGLAAVPPSIFEIRSIEELCLSHNSISILDSSILKLQNLKILELSHNNLEQIPADIGRCRGIIILRCENNHIRSLPSTIGQLSDLRTLYLKNNQMAAIPDEFGQLNLEQVDLSSNKLERVPECFGRLKFLQFLDLSNNSILSVNENMHEMGNLLDLNLESNRKLQSLPQGFAGMKKLEKLNLSKCAFSDIPPPVVQVKTLKTLIMNCNKITRLKKEFNNLDSLECIDLSNNQLISDDCLRDIFSKMIQLARVNLSYNHIARFPNFFFCESIRYIDISYNELQEVDNSDLAGLNNLQYLNLSHNNILRLTESVVHIKNLKEFDVSFNKIKQIGLGENEEHIAVWPEITRINLESNELSEVPSCLLRSERMGNLENLACINIKSNNVEKLPNELQGLKKLKEFNCANNNVKNLSAQLHSFMKGKKMDIDINELKVQGEELTPMRKRMLLSKRESRNFDKLLK